MTLVKHGSPRVINEWFDEVLKGYPATWGRDSYTKNVFPAVNIHETNEAYQLELVAAGLNKEDFKIQAENDLLTISFEKKEEGTQTDAKVIRREFVHQSFKRSFSLDEKINVEGIQAKYENGVLKLTLPKKEEVKATPKEITIL